jgi:flagellar hook-associated protein 1 FlgK
MNSVLSQVQGELGTSTTSGLSSDLDAFFNSWSTLAASPTSKAAAAAVVSAGQTLADSFQQLSQSISGAETSTNQTISSDVTQVNQLASQIAALNGDIAKAGGSQSNVNDLVDQRDELVDKLSSLANVNVVGNETNSTIISIGGHVLVQGTQANTISVSQANGQTSLTWGDDDSAVNISSGELGGLMTAVNTTLAGYSSTLNSIASEVVNQVNAIHSTGTDLNGDQAGDFFVAGTDASNIAVNSSLVADPGKVAVSDTTGDNSIANSLADLSSQSQSALNNQTYGSSYATLVSQIGDDVQSSETDATDVNDAITQLTSQQSSISGVSIDQEMTNMTQYEQSYEAAGRVFTIMNSMLSDVVQNLGNISEAG